MTVSTKPTGVAPGPSRTSNWLALWRGRAILAAVAVLAAAFLGITLLVTDADLRPTAWDVAITREIQLLPQPGVGDFLDAVSWPGFQPFNFVLPAVVVVFMLICRWVVEAVFTLLSSLGGILAELVKNIVDRPRPTPDLVHVTGQLHTYSFPSGHVTSYVVLFGFIFYLAYTLLPRAAASGVWRRVILSVCALMIVLVGPSRVYMGQHWASDVLGGYALGFGYLLLVIELYRMWQHAHPRNAQPAVTAENLVAPDDRAGHDRAAPA